MGCPRNFPRSKHLNLSYERAFGAYTANQEIDVATQHNFCAANQKRENQTVVPRSPTFRRVSLKGRPRLFRNGFERFHLPPNRNHEHITGFPVPCGWPSSCPPFCAFLCAKTSWLESAWRKLMTGIQHWKPREAGGKANRGENLASIHRDRGGGGS